MIPTLNDFSNLQMGSRTGASTSGVSYMRNCPKKRGRPRKYPVAVIMELLSASQAAFPKLEARVDHMSKDLGLGRSTIFNYIAAANDNTRPPSGDDG